MVSALLYHELKCEAAFTYFKQDSERSWLYTISNDGLPGQYMALFGDLTLRLKWSTLDCKAGFCLV